MNAGSHVQEKWVDSTYEGTPFSVLARSPDGLGAFLAMVRIDGRDDHVEPLGQEQFVDLDSAIEAGIAFACGKIGG